MDSGPESDSIRPYRLSEVGCPVPETVPARPPWHSH